MQDAPHTPVILVYSLIIPTCRSPLTAVDSLKQLGVPTETANKVAFYTPQSLFHATVLPIDRFHFKMVGFMSINFMAKSVLNSYNGTRLNKQFHSKDTLSNSPTRHVE